MPDLHKHDWTQDLSCVDLFVLLLFYIPIPQIWK